MSSVTDIVPGFTSIKYVYVPTKQHAVKTLEVSAYYDDTTKTISYQQVARSQAKN